MLKRQLLAKELRWSAKRITSDYFWWGHKNVTEDAVFRDIQSLLESGAAGHCDATYQSGGDHSVFLLLFLAEALEDPTWLL